MALVHNGPGPNGPGPNDPGPNGPGPNGPSPNFRNSTGPKWSSWSESV